MSRLILPQFKDVRTGEVDRSLDVEEIDAAFARVAKALNGGLSEENFAPGLKFAIGATASTVQSAWASTKSAFALVGRAGNPSDILAGGVTTIVLGATGHSTWTPVEASGVVLSDATAPELTFYYGASGLTSAITALAMTDAEKAVYRITDATKTAYKFSTTTFLAATIAAGTLIKVTSSQPIYGVSTVSASFTASHL
jgi:predicted phage tail protein